MVKHDASAILFFSFTLYFFATLPHSITSKGNLRSFEKRMLEEEGGSPKSTKKEGKHPCRRTCEEGETKTCRYDFEIEHYSTLSHACLDCPSNASHCALKDCISADGIQRTVLVVNRQLPGPAIEVCVGDMIEVNVKNNMLDVSTTLHWHGMKQKENPFMDGVPFVSQCLISPHSNFSYKFIADIPGTHFWHSHSALQRGDGLFGPLIIRMPPHLDPVADLFDFDLSEHVVTILDWDHKLASNKFVAHYHSFGDNKPPSILVNGKGRYKEFEIDDQTVFTPVEKFTVKSGFRYRFRIISAAFLNCPIQISVDNHNLTVVASDSGSLEPVEAGSLVVTAGERYDVILEADQQVANYWMRFHGLLDCEFKEASQVALLHYEGADEDAAPEADGTPDHFGPIVNAVNTGPGTEGSLVISELSSNEKEETNELILKVKPDLKFYIPFDFYPVNNPHYRYSYYPNVSENLETSYTPQINHIAMQFPEFPLMADLERSAGIDFCNASTMSLQCLHEFCECPHVLQVPLNSVVEVILIDEGVPFTANHPFHLHGHDFRVLAMGRLGESTNETAVRKLDQEGLIKRNLVNPPKKDTVTVPDGGYVVFRFHATNPGFWILHCHIDFHVEMGMALLFKIGDYSTFKEPPPNFPMCGYTLTH